MMKEVHIAVMDYASCEIRLFSAYLKAENVADDIWAVQDETILEWLEKYDPEWNDSMCYYMSSEQGPIQIRG